MPAARDFLPLFLLALAWASPSFVHGQEVKLSLVATHYLEVNWLKAGMWMGVDDYEVYFDAEGSSPCSRTINCPDYNCTFSSLDCGVVAPCTFTNITVTGAGHSAQSIPAVTGPEAISELHTTLKQGVEYIGWVNPSINSSHCYNSTVVRMSFNGKESVSYYNYTVDRASRALCVDGYGEVEVWTQGGDGRSVSFREPIIYNGSSVVDLVKFEACEPSGCDGIHVTWSYNSACPDVTHLNVRVGATSHNVSSNTTELTVTGLEVDKDYSTCIYAVDEYGHTLDYFCKYCNTEIEVPRNLVVTPLSSTALHCTWDPPLCHRVPMAKYKLRVDYPYYYTTATQYDVSDLSSCNDYEVRLSVGDYYDDDEMLSTTATTLQRTPHMHIGSVTQDQIYVYWSFYKCSHDDLFKITWGKSLQYEDVAKNDHYIITDFNSTEEVFKVCVAAYPWGREDLLSLADCEYVRDPAVSSSINGVVIAGIILGVTVIILAIVFGFVLHHSTKQKQQRRLQQQLQQRRQQEEQQWQQELQHPSYGIHNPAADT